MNFIAQNYFQGRQEYLSLIMDLRTIKKYAKALVYEEHEYGYQRPIDTRHSNKIKKKVIEGNPLFPTSIILGIDYKVGKDLMKPIPLMENLIDPNSASQPVYFTVNEDSPQNLFRIIDGQHRITGLSSAAEEDNSIWDLPLNVTVLLIPQDKRVIELNVFEDINSTPKKLKTDLVLLARQKYVLLGEENLKSKNELESYLAIMTSFILNEELERSVWINGIKFEKEINSQLGIIGISAFTKAIMPLVREKLKGKINCTISELNTMAIELATYIDSAWRIVFEKWKGCFNTQHLIIDSEEYTFSYNGSYYLQKTTGVNAISQILSREGSLQKFESIIINSPLIEEDWIKGGKLAGLTSGTGFKKAVNLIIKGDQQEDDLLKYFNISE